MQRESAAADAAFPRPDSPTATRLADALGQLPHPGAAFRGLPFWSWNARLEPSELRRQIRLFRDMGFGGFFMHSREGLATRYLGAEWFDCVRACADEAAKWGMRAWAYDEDRWPSGAAGGLVTTEPRFRNRALVREPSGAVSAGDAESVVAWFAETPEDGSASGDGPAARRGERLVGGPSGEVPRLARYRRVAGPGARLRTGESLVRYAVRVAGGQPRFNGGAYLDTLNPAAVREFVRVTHEAYARELGPGLSAAGPVPGFFTDEPNVIDEVPWTAGLPAAFLRRCGYDLRDRLPELFAIVGGEAWSAFRHDFHDVVALLFCRAYVGTIDRWCRRHGVLDTGHALAEDTPRDQTDRCGSAMRFYEGMQAPGIDLLTERWMPVLTAKQCASAARQCGRPFRLCETYGCTGWDFPLEGHKALGDWLLALGINHRVHHLAWYSMAGRVKRDYPASISRQSPWHRAYKPVEDYFARAATLAGQGREMRDLLVLHPVESVWGARVGYRNQPELVERDGTFVALASDLLARHLDFDFGDEDILARRASVRRGKAPALRVGRASYRAVLVPGGLETIRSSTLALLRGFAAAGGAVFASGDPPRRVDGRPSRDPERLWRGAFRPVAPDADALDAALSPFVRRLSLAQDGAECAAALVHERAWRDGTAYFVANTSTEFPRDVARMMGGMPRVVDRPLAYPKAELRIPAPRRGAASVREVDLFTGAVRDVPFRRDGDWLAVPCALGRLQSRLFVAGLAPSGAVPAAHAASRTAAPHPVGIPRRGLAYALDEPNALVLDMARWDLGGVAAGRADDAPRQVLEIDRAARAALGLAPRGGLPYQPWAVEAGMAPPQPPATAPMTLRFAFRVEDGASAVPCELAMERPDLWAAELNGVPIPVPRRRAWWIDPCLERLPLPAGALREGANELVLRCAAFGAAHPGLESAYLLGAFGVSPDGASMRRLPATLRLGDLAAQGLPNYGGNVTYRFRAAVPAHGAVRVVPPAWSGTAIGFRVNGGAEAFRFAPPYEVAFDGPALRRDGSDEFGITVYGSRRNQLGPFYLPGGVAHPVWTGNGEMDCTETAPVRTLVPFGLGTP